MKGKIAGRCLSVLPAIFIMVIIFYFSSKSATESTAQSSAVSSFVIKVASFLSGLGFQDHSSVVIAETVEILVRKCSHVFEYFCLTIAVFIPHNLYVSGRYKIYISTFAICVIYAISDEVHQIFVPGRGPAARDVLIDSLGVTLALLIIFAFKKIHGKRLNHE